MAGNKRNIPWLILLLFTCGSTLSAKAEIKTQIRATTNTSRIGVGEIFKYQITVESSEQPKITLPEFQGLRVLATQSSTSYSFGRAQKTMKYEIEYTLVAETEGTITLPTLQAKIQKEIKTSPPVTITIVKKSLPEDLPRKKRPQEQTIPEDLLLEGAISL